MDLRQRIRLWRMERDYRAIFPPPDEYGWCGPKTNDQMCLETFLWEKHGETELADVFTMWLTIDFLGHRDSPYMKQVDDIVFDKLTERADASVDD